MNKQRVIPLIVATALFMENMDSTVIATSLPAIAADIGTDPLALKKLESDDASIGRAKPLAV